MAKVDLPGLLKAIQPFVDPSSKYKRLALRKKNLEENVEDALTLYYFTIFSEYRERVLSSAHLADTCYAIKDKLSKMQKNWDTLDQFLECVELLLPILAAARGTGSTASHSFLHIDTLVNGEKVLSDLAKQIKLECMSDEIDVEEDNLRKFGEAVIQLLPQLEGKQEARNIVRAWKITCDKQQLDDFLQETKSSFGTTVTMQPTSELAKGIHERLCRGESIEKIVSAYENADPIDGIRVKLTKKFVGELRDLKLK